MSAPLPSALRLKLSPATGARWGRAIRTRGHAEPLPQGRPKGHGKLAVHRPFFEELLAQDPDITLFELRDALVAAEGVRVHHSSIASLRMWELLQGRWICRRLKQKCFRLQTH